jgi:hypothetical protein
MPNFTFVRSTLAEPAFGYVPAALNCKIRVGDALIASAATTSVGNSAGTTGPTWAARPIIEADETDDTNFIACAAGATTGGVLGVAMEDIDCSNATPPIGTAPGAPSTVAANVAMPGFGPMARMRDADQYGFPRILVAFFVPGMVFRGKIVGTEYAKDHLVGKLLAIDGLADRSTPGTQVLDTSLAAGAPNAPFHCVGVDRNDPLYQQLGGPIFFEVLPNWAQHNYGTYSAA